MPVYRRKAHMIALTVLTTLLVAVGCNGSTPETPSRTTESDPFPRSIVSLSPTATETLFAVGAGDQVVAVDSQSDYPTDAPKTDLSAYTPSLEAIVGYEPDLVIASDDIGGLVTGLADADVETLLLPAATSIDDAYSQIQRIADATGHDEEGEALVADMKQRIDAAVASVPEQPRTYFHELDTTLYTVTSSSFVGQIYGLFDLDSIADGSAGGDYPQMSDEGVVSADPDVIFLADSQCCGVTTESVSARPGWNAIRAVRDGKIFAMDEDLSSRWGPRIADQVEALAQTLKQ